MKKTIFLVFVLLFSLQIALASPFEITSTPQTTAQVNIQYSYQVEVQNNENYDLSYDVDGPKHMTINSEGLLTWISSEAGSFPVEINVSGTNGTDDHFEIQSFTLQVVSTPSQFNVGPAELGSSTQERGQRETFNYVIENTGSFPITNVDVELNAPSRYNAEVVVPNEIPPNSQVTALISIDVPSDADARRSRIGSLTITGSSDNPVNPLNRDMFLTTKNNLVVEQVEVTIDGRRERLTSPGSIGREAQLGSTVEIAVRVLNDASDLDMEDIDVELLSLDLEDADGLETSVRRLRPGRTTNDLTLSFTIDATRTDPEDSPFELELIIFGIDENNARHGETWILDLELETRTRDVKIISTSLNPASVSCTTNRMTLSTEIRNVGSRDLNQAMVRVVNQELGISEFRRPLDIRRGDFLQSTITFNLPSNAQPGEHILEVYAHPTQSTGDWTDAELVTIFIPNCDEATQPETPTTPPPTDGGIVVQPGDPVVVPGVPVSQAPRRGFSDGYLIALTILVAILAVIVIVLLVKLVS